MWSRSAALYAICIGYAAVGGARPMAALTIEECSAKYRAANSETGRIITWQRFRKDNCGAGAARGSATAAPRANRSVGALTMEECSAKYRDANSETGRIIIWEQFRKDNCGADAARRSATAAEKANRSMGFNPGLVFPQAISPKYANEPAGRARMHTCLDQYRANKETNGNSSLKWNTKHGGYYRKCNKRLKG
jgi:hypothetical protein